MVKTNTLVILSPGFPASDADSAFLPAQQTFVRALQKKYPTLKIIVISFHYPLHEKTYTLNGVVVYSLNAKGKKGLKRLLLWKKIWSILKTLKKENKIIGILSFWANELSFIGKYFARQNKIKQLIWISGQDAKKGNKFISLINPRPDELVALSDFLAKEFYSNYHIMPANVIPNGIDKTLFKNETFIRTIDILGVGSLIPLKQYELFIKVVISAKNRIPHLKCVIYGNGTEKDNLIRLTKISGMEKTISFPGVIDHPQVLEKMKMAKILLHPSAYEGFSGACIEAIYAGAHVVSFTKPMDHDIPHWHVVKTIEEMTDRVLSLLSDPTTEYTPVEVYTMDESAKAMMQLFGL